MSTQDQWAPAIKRRLGDVWHFVKYGGSAHCDHRIRLGMSYAKDKAPPDAYVCKRCAAILIAILCAREAMEKA